jgi:hypothetical protein
MSNHKAIKRDGAHLEVSQQWLWRLHSHRGVEVGNFLLELPTELLSSYELSEWNDPPFLVTISHTLEIPVDITSQGEGKKVPYSSAACDLWPATFKGIEGVHSGELSQTADQIVDLKGLSAIGESLIVITLTGTAMK